MLAYLCVLNNPLDDLRLRRIVNNPPRGIGGTTMDKAAALAEARGLPPVGGSDAHDQAEVGNAWTELEAEEPTLDGLRAALASGRCRAVLAKNTSRLRKGLSQWTKARRAGGLRRLGTAALYVCWCAALDALRPLGRNG